MFDTEEWPGLEKKKYLKQFKPTHTRHRGVSFGEMDGDLVRHNYFRASCGRFLGFLFSIIVLTALDYKKEPKRR